MAKYVNEANLQRFWDNIQDQIGNASQEQVDAWLDEHPEATTTVQDGAVTTAKLADGAVTDQKLADNETKANVVRLMSSAAKGVLTNSVSFASDAARAQPVSLKVYGSATQSGTPSVTTPAEVTVVSSVEVHAGATANADADGWPISVNLQGNKLCSLPIGTRDTLSIDSSGSVTLTKAVQYVELTSTMNWSISTNTANNLRKFYVDGVVSYMWTAGSDYAMSNRFTVPLNNPYFADMQAGTIAVQSTNGGRLCVCVSTDVNSLELFKTWLDNNPTVFLMREPSERIVSLGTVTWPSLPSPTAVIRCTPEFELAYMIDMGASVKPSAGHVTDADFMRRSVTSTALGTLANVQSFCVYGGNYYSTDGSTVKVQSQDFALTQTATLSLGHGNAFQLGSDGSAYVSGWDDGKVYVVDLSTLTITSIITLPVSGYTTAAVDDENGIAYIFYREDRPSTVAAYTLITYDYAHSQTLSTRKIKAYAAMQACDYYEGRIVVAYGLGTAVAPSGMFVCNTAGDILAEYDLNIFASTEPEGVCYDRETGELLLSLVNGNVYRIESA